MTTLENALGLTILHSLWEGAAVAAILLAALGVIRSSRLRYAAACAAMLAMVAGFVLTLIHFAPERYAAPAAELNPYALTAGSATPHSARGPLNAPGMLAWLAPLWLAGVILFHLYSIAGWIATRRLRYRGVWSAADRWCRRLDELRAEIQLSRPVALLESCFAGVPVVIGLIRPVILMPAGMLAGLPPSQIEAILLHELAHIRRYDYLVNLIGTVFEGFLFYHPAVWWISRVIRDERENCCDDFVVAGTGDTHGYASALASLEQSRWRENRLVLAAGGGSLVKRIRRLLNPAERSRAGLAPFLSAAVLAIGAAMVLTAWQTQPASQSPNASAWDKWETQDVAYIITDRERQDFKALNSDPERQQFVEQFWLRRDPTPGTPENEFKEEHYRRIAYTNAHFTSSLPGWKTDMGRIYITYGPPDEVDSHPSGHPGVRPFQQWSYRYLQGIGNNVTIEFVDKQSNGEFLMTMDPSEKLR